MNRKYLLDYKLLLKSEFKIISGSANTLKMIKKTDSEKGVRISTAEIPQPKTL